MKGKDRQTPEESLMPNTVPKNPIEPLLSYKLLISMFLKPKNTHFHTVVQKTPHSLYNFLSILWHSCTYRACDSASLFLGQNEKGVIKEQEKFRNKRDK